MERSIHRRRFVSAAGLSVMALSGCLGDDGGDDHDHGDDGGGDHDHEPDGRDHGDDTDAPGSEGLLYAFAPDAIGIVDPAEGEVVDALETVRFGRRD